MSVSQEFTAVITMPHVLIQMAHTPAHVIMVTKIFEGGFGRANDCINIDECIRETDECDSINSLCVDDVGPHTCECNAG